MLCIICGSALGHKHAILWSSFLLQSVAWKCVLHPGLQIGVSLCWYWFPTVIQTCTTTKETTSLISSHLNRVSWINAIIAYVKMNTIFLKTQTNKSRPSMNNGCQCVLIEHQLATECRTDGTDTSPFNHTRHFLCILNNDFLSFHDPISS